MPNEYSSTLLDPLSLQQDSLDAVTSDVKDVVPILTRNQTTEESVQRVKTTSVSGKGVDLVLDFVGLSETFIVAKNSLRMVHVLCYVYKKKVG